MEVTSVVHALLLLFLLLLLLLFMLLLLLLQLALLLPLRKSVCIARNHCGAARPVTLRSALLCSQAYSVAAGIFNSSATHTYTDICTHIHAEKGRCFTSSSLRFLLCSTAFQLLQMIFLSTCVYASVCVSLCVCSLSLCVCSVHSAVRCEPRYSKFALGLPPSPEHLIFIVSCTF